MAERTVSAPPVEFSDAASPDSAQPSLFQLLLALRRRAGLLVLAPLLAGVLSIGVTALIPPTFTAITTFLPPQQPQSQTASALASLGSLAGLAGVSAPLRNTSDLYIALMQSVTVSDRIIDQFKLMELYDIPIRKAARIALSEKVRIVAGKKDGLITVSVDDRSPQRAADMANHYVDELRRFTARLALTEAQQRRAFFERQMQQSRDRLTVAQQALQASGFNPGALKAEPKAAAEAYSRIAAELAAAEIKLQGLRTSLADSAPEVQLQQSVVSSLRSRLAKAEQPLSAADGPDYVGKYREFKYQETLFELYARQFELARVDESREGAPIQVIDPAQPPELKSKPRRGFVAIASTMVTLLLVSAWVVMLEVRRTGRPSPG